MSPDIRDAMSHVKENDKWAYDLINYKLQTLQAKCDAMQEVIIVARNKLIEYANEDEIAQGYGSGCFTDPHVFIQDTIKQIDEALSKLKEDEGE